MILSQFEAENKKNIIIRIDGAARGNPGPAGVGGVIEDEKGQMLKEISEYVGETTNNVAEYLSLIAALKEAADYRAESLVVYSDSELLVRQINGEYKIKNEGLKPLVFEAIVLLNAYRDVSVNYVPREENKQADKLANQAIDDYEAGEKTIRKIVDLPEQGALF